MERLDTVRVEVGDRVVAIAWEEAEAIRRELVRMGLVKLEGAFASVGTTSPVRITAEERPRLLAAISALEESPTLTELTGALPR